MTAPSKLRGQKKQAASSFCSFAPVESFLVAHRGAWVLRGHRSGSHVTTVTACPRQAGVRSRRPAGTNRWFRPGFEPRVPDP